MWTVRNLLRGTLTFRGLGISIPPKGECDLDTLGRERAERSNQVLVAFEEGYIQTIAKDTVPGSPESKGIDQAALSESLQQFRDQIKEQLREELQAFRSSVVGDVRSVLEGLKAAKLKLTDEKRRVLVDDSLSPAEIRARLAVLEEQERELTKNFSSIGRKDAASSDGVQERADLLSSM
ncbi:hypothetical protein ACFL59_16470 [Planctomycetota bacterium]